MNHQSTMPLVKIDMIKNVRSPHEIRKLADVVQEVMLDKFAAPPRDRYQVRNYTFAPLPSPPVPSLTYSASLPKLTHNEKGHHPARTLRTHLRRHRPWHPTHRQVGPDSDLPARKKRRSKASNLCGAGGASGEGMSGAEDGFGG